MKATIESVERLRVDALYGKKKHFNAADRKSRLRLILNIPVIVINVFLSSLLLALFRENSPEYTKIIAAILSLAAAVLSGLSTFLDLAKQVEGHRRVGNRYLSVVKGCERLLAIYRDKLLKPEELVERFEALAATADEINGEAESLHTNDSDYKRAQRGLKSGEEVYLPEEIRK